MIKPHLNIRLLKLLLPIFLLTFCLEPASSQQPLVVFLVRHAEKVDNSEKSNLSPAGMARANKLAATLRNAGVDYVHSTDFIRTRKTASPIATKLGLEIGLYDIGGLPDFVKQMKNKGGRHLVVGHSNTTPELVKMLGGEPGAKIKENEYDRLYIVTIDKNNVVSTVLLRFGDVFIPKAGK